jgi:hypothetical protein
MSRMFRGQVTASPAPVNVIFGAPLKMIFEGWVNYYTNPTPLVGTAYILPHPEEKQDISINC